MNKIFMFNSFSCYIPKILKNLEMSYQKRFLEVKENFAFYLSFQLRAKNTRLGNEKKRS